MAAIDNIRALCARGIYSNTPESALPQTAVAHMIDAFLASPDGGRRRRVLVYGLDGVRADCCPVAYQQGGCAYLAKAGDNVLSYAGGDKSRPETIQQTCTWQGWASILTGEWGIVNGVVEFTPVRGDCPTVLLRAARRGLSCSLSVVWPDHFKMTYSGEIEAAKNEKLPLYHILAKGEDDLHKTVLDRIDAGDDIIFSISDGPDHAGHSTGFSPDNPEYVKEVCKRDMLALEAIRHIEERGEFSSEDWLYIITTDHGGHALTHFDQSDDDRFTFIAANKKELFNEALRV